MPFVNIEFNQIQNSLNHLLKNNTNINELKADNDLCLNGLKFANKDLIKQLAMSDIQDHNIDCLNFIEGNSDLKPNQYEGGFKLWEGLQDLSHYLNQSKVFDQFSNQNFNILELGCGSGLVSIYCSKLMPNSDIYLQDFNEEVIKYFTAINVFLNNQNIEKFSKFHFLCGDWSETAGDVKNIDNKFDLILTSETIYNYDNYRKLVNVFKSSLSDDGIVYIASKSHYFGVGGGTYSFVEFIENDGLFDCQICHEIEAPLMRHIIKLKWKK